MTTSPLVDHSEPFWEEAEDYLTKLEFDNALAVYRKALITFPNDVRIIDAMGSVMMQQGDFKEAEHLYQISIALAPNVGFEKYLNLAELATGKQSLQLYEKGLNILAPIREQTTDPTTHKELTGQLISGLCAVAEIYMTDECFEPHAEATCQHVLTEALKYDPNNAEALQVMASFKISQQNNEEAANFLEKSYEVWAKIDEGDDTFPSFEFRVSAAKLFLELEKNETSTKILHQLLEEDPENAELWFLQGFALVTNDLKESLECLLKSKTLLTATGCMEEVILTRVNDSIKNVKQMMAEEGLETENKGMLVEEEESMDDK